MITVTLMSAEMVLNLYRICCGSCSMLKNNILISNSQLN